MDISRFKKALAGMSVAAMLLTEVGTVFAAYSDVPSGVWYEEAVEAFLDMGYLDTAQPRFRGSEPANRAEFVKLVVMLNGGLLSTPPAVPSFSDVPTGAWYYQYFEEAAKEGWVRGDGDCYGKKPCYARPSANINRAEAAALIVRSFGLEETGAAAQFVDNPSGQWYTDSIQTAADHCVLQGDDSTGRVRPGDNMNRAEMVVMLHRVDQGLSYGVDCGVEAPLEAGISDVVATSTNTVEVEFTVAVDEVSAEDAEAYTITPALDVSSAKLIAQDTVELTLGEEMVAEKEYTLAVDGVESQDGDVITDTAAFEGYTAVVKGDGELELSLASSSPKGDTLPKGAVGVVMLSVDFTASCRDSVEIENLTVLHEGFGASSDIDGVYAAVDGARVSRKRTIDSEDQTTELRFSSPLVIDPCETVTVDLVADFATGAATAAEHNLVVELASDVASNAAEVGGNFPLRGETFKLAAVTSGTITVTYRSVNPSQVQVGDAGVTIGKFEISANSTEDQTLYSLTLEQNSSASDGDFANIAVRRTDGTVLTNTVAQTVGDFVTLVFDPPFTVLEGDKMTLEVVADIVGGADNAIQMHFEESSDLFAVGSLYGYGVNGQLYGSQVSITATPAASSVTIDAGEFSIGINGPATQEYTSDDNDAVLANIEFTTGGEDIDVKTLYVAILGQTSTGADMCSSGGAGTSCSTYVALSSQLEGVEIRNKATGRTVSAVRLTGTSDYGQADGSSDHGEYQIYRFDDFVVKGKQTWELRVDFIANSGSHPKNGDKFKAIVCGEPTDILSSGTLTDNTTGCDFAGIITASESYQMQVEGISTGDKVGDVRPRGSIAGNFQNIADASLTVAVRSLTATDTAVENAKDITLMRFEAKAGSAEDVLFTKAVFDETTADAENIVNYALWVDTDGDRTVDTILEDGVAAQSTQVSFSDLAGGGYVIPAEQTVVFEVHGDVASSLKSTTTLELGFDTDATYIEAEELDDGSSLSGIKTDGTCSSTCDITVTTTGTTTTSWTFRTQGDLYVTKDSTPLRNRQLLAGALGEPILRLQFHAEYEDVDVTDLQFNSSGATATSVDSLELYLAGATTPFATAGGCGSQDVLANQATGSGESASTTAFCATMDSKQLVIPKGQDVDVLVRPLVKADTAGGDNGETIALFINKQAVSNDSTGSGAVRARGVQSSNNLSANDGDATAEGEVFIGRSSANALNAAIVGNKNVVVGAKITAITNGLSSGGGMPTGQSTIGAFTFTAATNVNSKDGYNDAALSGVVFTVNATNVAFAYDGFSVYNRDDANVTQSCSPFTTAGVAIAKTTSGVFLVECRAMVAAAINTEIDTGDSLTLVLKGNITNPNTGAANGGTSVLQVQLQDFSNITDEDNYGVESGKSRLQWLDTDNSASVEFEWVEFSTTEVSSSTFNG